MASNISASRMALTRAVGPAHVRKLWIQTAMHQLRVPPLSTYIVTIACSCIFFVMLLGCSGLTRVGSSSTETTSANATQNAPPAQNPPPPAQSPPPTTRTTTNLQEASGWLSCTATLNGQVCASGLGDAKYSIIGPVISPSLDNDATEFQIGGPTPYSNALWWKGVAPDNNAYNFEYDLWFYLSEPAKSQSLEFDVNQSIAELGKWFVFGTQCNFKDSHKWDVWDGTREEWHPTDVPCEAVAASIWHHLVLDFQRTDAGMVTFVSVSLDEHKSAINETFETSRTSTSDAVNVAFQMDGDYAQQSYSVWLDKVTLASW